MRAFHTYCGIYLLAKGPDVHWMAATCLNIFLDFANSELYMMEQANCTVKAAQLLDTSFPNRRIYWKISRMSLLRYVKY